MSCTLPLPSTLLSLGFSRVLVAIWPFNSPQVGIVLGVCLPLFAWVGKFILGLGSLVLGPPTIYIYIYRERERESLMRNQSTIGKYFKEKKSLRFGEYYTILYLE